nr:unnamed protein product [Callosobruchus analis]
MAESNPKTKRCRCESIWRTQHETCFHLLGCAERCTL